MILRDSAFRISGVLRHERTEFVAPVSSDLHSVLLVHLALALSVSFTASAADAKLKVKRLTALEN